MLNIKCKKKKKKSNKYLIRCDEFISIHTNLVVRINIGSSGSCCGRSSCSLLLLHNVRSLWRCWQLCLSAPAILIILFISHLNLNVIGIYN